MLRYPRLALAEEFAAALQGKTFFNIAHEGLFLAAPRRTGKSTFLRADLTPALERAGAVVVYVDLWADRRGDPCALIAEAIGQALRARRGFLAKAAQKAGLGKFLLTGRREIDIGKIGQANGVTLADALRALHEAARAPVALIVDEAQQVFAGMNGEATMKALKSARDQMNSSKGINLMLVMAGSDRARLLRLVETSRAAFFGSSIQPLPELDMGFIVHIAGQIETQRPELKPVDCPALFAAFQGFGCRPEFFMEAVGQALSPLAGLTGRFEQAVQEAARQRQAAEEARMASDYLGLEPLEQAVLWRMLELGPRFRPYDAEALKFYREQTKTTIKTPQVQNALETLRQHMPALVWKSARGEYSVNDAAMYRWYLDRKNTGNWPPADAQIVLDFDRE